MKRRLLAFCHDGRTVGKKTEAFARLQQQEATNG